MGDQVMGGDLQQILHAGKVQFPSSAALVADTAMALSDARDSWSGQLAKSGNARPLADAVAINAEVYTLLRRAVQTLEDGAHTLVAVADEFHAADVAAAGRNQHLKNLVNSPLELPKVPPPLSGTDQ